MITSLLLLAVLVAATWFGSACVPWLLAVALVLAALVLWCVPRGAGTAFRGGWVFPAALLLYVAVQALNASHTVDTEGGGLLPRAHLAWLPHSVDAVATTAALATILLAGLLFWLAARHVPANRQRMLLVLLAVSGVVVALAGILGRPVEGGRSAMGPFVNENHFAAWLNLLTPLTLALAARGDGRRGLNQPASLLYVAAACMVAGVVVSASRAGLLVAGGQLVVLALLAWRARRNILVTVAGVATVALVALFAEEALRARVDEWQGRKLAIALQMRGDALRGTLGLIADQPVYGIGAGAFARAFPYYQPEALRGYFRHAHNDWLQTLAELGMAGTLLLAFAVADLLRPTWSRLRVIAADGLGRAVMLSVAGLALHALVDFPMQIPAIVLTAAVLVGLAWSRCAPPVPVR